jgi:hypothetical protein
MVRTPLTPATMLHSLFEANGGLRGLRTSLAILSQKTNWLKAIEQTQVCSAYVDFGIGWVGRVLARNYEEIWEA